MKKMNDNLNSRSVDDENELQDHDHDEDDREHQQSDLLNDSSFDASLSDDDEESSEEEDLVTLQEFKEFQQQTTK